jgi:hypothetical protein
MAESSSVVSRGTPTIGINQLRDWPPRCARPFTMGTVRKPEDIAFPGMVWLSLSSVIPSGQSRATALENHASGDIFSD